MEISEDKSAQTYAAPKGKYRLVWIDLLGHLEFDVLFRESPTGQAEITEPDVLDSDYADLESARVAHKTKNLQRDAGGKDLCGGYGIFDEKGYLIVDDSKHHYLE